MKPIAFCFELFFAALLSINQNHNVLDFQASFLQRSYGLKLALSCCNKVIVHKYCFAFLENPFNCPFGAVLFLLFSWVNHWHLCVKAYSCCYCDCRVRNSCNAVKLKALCLVIKSCRYIFKHSRIRNKHPQVNINRAFFPAFQRKASELYCANLEKVQANLFFIHQKTSFPLKSEAINALFAFYFRGNEV